MKLLFAVVLSRSFHCSIRWVSIVACTVSLTCSHSSHIEFTNPMDSDRFYWKYSKWDIPMLVLLLINNRRSPVDSEASTIYFLIRFKLCEHLWRTSIRNGRSVTRPHEIGSLPTHSDATASFLHTELLRLPPYLLLLGGNIDLQIIFFLIGTHRQQIVVICNLDECVWEEKKPCACAFYVWNGFLGKERLREMPLTKGQSAVFVSSLCLNWQREASIVSLSLVCRASLLPGEGFLLHKWPFDRRHSSSHSHTDTHTHTHKLSFNIHRRFVVRHWKFYDSLRQVELAQM